VGWTYRSNLQKDSVRPTAAGDRVQLLLVGLHSANEATDIILRVKLLGKSTDDQVYAETISRNLTPIEAKFAYEERCRRRRNSSTRTIPG